MQASSDGLADSPAWLPHAIDARADQALLVRRTEEEYRAASFLDDRSVHASTPRQVVAWSQVAAALPRTARRDAQYIFHIGNVGSTLISRLLGELPGVLALREPQVIRAFAELLGPVPHPLAWAPGEAAARAETLVALLSRAFRAEQRANVKATSFTSEIAHLLVPEGSRALLLFATPQHFIENILAGENSVKLLQVVTPGRIARLATRCPGLAAAAERMSDAEKAALGWACEMTSLEQAAERLGAERVMWLDFDLFLTDPAKYFLAIAGFFGCRADEARAAAICSGPLMRRYSKALEYEYSPQLRAEILAEARARHGSGIGSALDWLDRLGADYPAVARAIRRSRGGE